MNDPSQQPWPPSFPFSFNAMEQSHHNDSTDPYTEAWPIPSAAAMEDRWHHRNTILEDTANHVLVHPHDGMSDTGRNIALVLYDRERRGPRAVTTRAHLNRSRMMEDSDYTQAEVPALCNVISKIGDRSPSTVLESPLQRAATIATGNDAMAMRTSLLPAAVGHLSHSPRRSTVDSAEGDEDGTPHSPNYAAEKPSLRRVTYPLTIAREIRTFGEYCSATKYHSAFLTHLGGDDVLDAEGNRPTSSRAVSTISVAFSPDGHTMASTHGDHTVKISCCSTGRLLVSLDGHPRTPWTVKYHPTDSRVLASGCLGHQVRVWNWEAKTCLQMIRLEYAIISLSFHPSGAVLAIANGTRLHFWGINDCEPPAPERSAQHQLQKKPSQHPSHQHQQQQQRPFSVEPTAQPQRAASNSRAARLTEMDQRHMLRCVHFPPDGTTLIIGGVNPIHEDPRRRRGGNNGGIGGNGGMSFYLRLWDFDLEKALETAPDNDAAAAASPIGISMARRALSNPRTFVPRALLYNDGGFDLSSDGKTLCACAEYWLPDGVDNAMELLHKEEVACELEIREKESQASSHTFHGVPQYPYSASMSMAETHSAVSAALAGLRSIADAKEVSTGSSHSLRDEMDHSALPSTPVAESPEGFATQPLSDSGPLTGFVPRTPPVSMEPRLRNLSPPPPPGSRFMGRGIMRTSEVSTYGGQPLPNQAEAGSAGAGAYIAGPAHYAGVGRGMATQLPQPPPPPAPGGMTMRAPHPLSVISVSSVPTSSSTHNSNEMFAEGRYVPHVVTISLDTTPIPEEARDASVARGKPPGAVARGYRPRLGQLLEACPLDANKASAVTCVKFSPSTDFCLIGYGVREPVVEGGGHFHPVTAVYRVRGGMDHVSTMLSGDDDVNIARFHPDSGHSFIYGTKQGRVRVLSPRPWNFYCSD